MKQIEIRAGKTYSNKSGKIHRKVLSLRPAKDYRGVHAENGELPAVAFVVTKGASNRHNGREGACLLSSMSWWADHEVKGPL